MTKQTFSGPDYIPDIREIVLILWRRRVVLVAVTALMVFLGLAYALVRPNVYTATSTVLIEDHNLNLTDFSDVNAGAKYDEKTVQTEVGILNSPNLALQTIKDTKLNETAEFRADRPEDAIGAFENALNVKVQGTSRVIEVSFTSKDPALAARVTNEHVGNYLKSQIAVKQKRVEDLGKMFEDKVGDLKADVVAKSEKVEAFRSKENLVFGKTDQELVYEQISNISDKLSPVQVHKYDVQSRLEAIDAAEKSGNPNAVADIVGSPLIQSLKEKASVANQLAQSARSQYGPNHPKLVMAKTELAQLNASIAAETRNIKESLKNDLLATTAQEQKLQDNLKDLQKQADDQREKMITLKSLIMEQEASQKLLDNFLSSYETIQSQTSFARPDALQISPAIVPSKPSGTGRKILLLIAVMTGGCLALAVVFILELMRGGVRNFEDLQRMGQNNLGVLPRIVNPHIEMHNAENSSYREAVKRIYMSSMMNAKARSILVTSALPEEGRTNFVSAIAYYLVSLGHKVVVVDADFLKPAFGRMGGRMGVSSEKRYGMTDVLAGRVALENAVVTDTYGLSVLSAGNDALSSPDALRSEKFRGLLAQLKSTYEYVLIDSGPLLSHAEAGVIAGEVDGIVAVVEWLKTSRQNVKNMLDTLKKFPTPVLGMVINKVNIDKYKSSNTGADFLLPKIGNA